MTRADALIELGKGKKLTHKYFLENEYIILVDNNILTEDGIRYNNRFFSALWAVDNCEYFIE